MVSAQRVRDLYLIVVKLMDVAARAGFILTATYGLRIDQAGQFGLIATIVGLFAFAFNFERQIDIQRRTAGEPQPVFDRAVTQALKFFAFNWTLMVPLFVLAVAWWTHAPWPIEACAILVVIGEHLSNQAYQYALISPRYYPLLLVVTAKNALLLLYILYRALIVRQGFDLAMVMQVWAIGAVIGTAGLGVMWWLRRDAAPLDTRFSFRNEVLSQHRASLVHFLIGLLAILILQYDRLAVGGLLTLEQTGLYFRHTLLVSLCYQAFNIVSFNRITPSVYAAAKTHKVDYLRGMVLREYLKTLAGTPLLLLLIWFADMATHGVYSRRFHLTIALMALLLFGFVLRAAADFPAMIMNAYHQERLALQRQAIAFFVGAVLLILLTLRFGVWGAASAGICTNGLYAALNWQVLGHLPKAIARRPPPGGATSAVGAPI